MIDVGIVEKNSPKWNVEWLQSNKEEFLYKNWQILHRFSNVYARTSCEVTAMALRKYLENHDDQEWDFLEDKTFMDIYHTHPYFQVSIGLDPYNVDHILTIYHDFIIQSYYNQYETKVTKLDQNFMNTIDQVQTSHYWQIICGLEKECLNSNKLKTFYWLPQ